MRCVPSNHRKPCRHQSLAIGGPQEAERPGAHVDTSLHQPPNVEPTSYHGKVEWAFSSGMAVFPAVK